MTGAGRGCLDFQNTENDWRLEYLPPDIQKEKARNIDSLIIRIHTPLTHVFAYLEEEAVETGFLGQKEQL